MAATPEVRVRLSAEGVAEVVAALRKIQGEGQAAAKNAGKGWLDLNGILGRTRELLAGLGLAFGAVAIVQFVKNAAEAAHQLEHGAESIGTTIDRLRGLQAMAARAGVDLDRLTVSAGMFSRKLTDLRDGNTTVAATFGRLHLAAADFAGMDTAQAIALVAERMANLKDGTSKTDLAMDLFGRSGARLIPTLNALGKVGLAGAAQAAEDLGIALDEDVIRRAGDVAVGFEIMQQQAQTLSIELISGVRPALAGLFDQLTQDAREGRGMMETLGRAIGLLIQPIRGLIFVWETFVETGGLAVAELLTYMSALGAAIVAVVERDFKMLPKIGDLMITQLKREKAEFDANMRSHWLALITPPKPVGGTDTGTGTGDPNAGAAARRLALQKTLADNELKLLQLRLKAEGDLEKRRYEAGETDIATYYANRRSILERGTEAEVAALRRQLAAETDPKNQPDPAAREQARARITGEIERREFQGQEELLGLIAEETDARQKNLRVINDTEAKLAAATGDQKRKSQLEIGREIAAYEAALGKEGVPFERIAALSRQYRTVLEAGAEFDRQIERARAALAEVDNRKAGLEQDVAAGRISEAQGQALALEAEKERIPLLEEIVRLAERAALATGDPSKLAAVRELETNVRALGAAAAQSDLMLQSFGSDATRAGLDALVGLLGESSSEFKSFGEAAVGALEAVIQAVRRLAAQIVATRLFELLRLIPGASGVPGTAVAPNPGVPLPERLARGGLVVGPGTAFSDSVRVFLSAGEYVVRAPVVARPGVRAHLEALNAGALDLSGADWQLVAQGLARYEPAPLRPRRRFAEGGAVARPVTATVSGQATIGLEDGLVLRALESPAGVRSILKVVSNKRRAFGRALGRS